MTLLVFTVACSSGPQSRPPAAAQPPGAAAQAPSDPAQNNEPQPQPETQASLPADSLVGTWEFVSEELSAESAARFTQAEIDEYLAWRKNIYYGFTAGETETVTFFADGGAVYNEIESFTWTADDNYISLILPTEDNGQETFPVRYSLIGSTLRLEVLDYGFEETPEFFEALGTILPAIAFEDVVMYRIFERQD